MLGILETQLNRDVNPSRPAKCDGQRFAEKIQCKDRLWMQGGRFCRKVWFLTDVFWRVDDLRDWYPSEDL
jgi:hypothetical protein